MEAYHPEHSIVTVKDGGGSIMFWRYVSLSTDREWMMLNTGQFWKRDWREAEAEQPKVQWNNLDQKHICVPSQVYTESVKM